MQHSILFSQTYLPQFLSGAWWTLVLSVGAWSIALLLGTAMALLRDAGNRWCQHLVALYVAYHRNVPALVHVMLWYFGISTLLPQGVQSWAIEHGGEMIFATLALGLCMSAYFCEDIRSGLRAIPDGQREASRSLGMTYMATMRHVMLPQAVRAAIPSFINNSVVLFKNTSMAMAIGVTELTYVVREIESETFRTFESYALATAFYISGSLVIMALGVWISHRLHTPQR